MIRDQDLVEAADMTAGRQRNSRLLPQASRTGSTPGRMAGCVPARIFLLSPANPAGIRGRLILSEGSHFELAARLQRDGLPLGELFSFISGLYFRGKLAYAQAFAQAPPGMPGVFVITACRGLVPPDRVITLAELQEMTTVPVKPSDSRYREPLERDVRMLSEFAGEGCEIVLLGQHRDPEVRAATTRDFGRAPGFPRRVRRAWRHEPGRADAALRAGWHPA